MKKPFGRYSVEDLRRVEEDHFDLTVDTENACPHQILQFYHTFSKIFAVFASPIRWLQNREKV